MHEVDDGGGGLRVSAGDGGNSGGGGLLAADHLKKHPLKMMSTLTIALNHSKEEEEE